MTRIEVDDKSVSDLDKIKAENHIYGKGYTDTISFLVRYYTEREKILKLIEDGLAQIPGAIEKATAKALQTVLTNLFKMAEE